MKNNLTAVLLLFGCLAMFGQTDPPKFYLGAAYGTSFSLGDFKDTAIDNPDAGFADNGRRLELYGGYYLDDRITLTGTLRYQNFDTEVGDLIADFNQRNPGVEFSGGTEDWQVYTLLFGSAYKVPLGKKFALYPRAGLGPMVVKNPGLSVQAATANSTQNFSRSSESGVGLGYELGFGFKTNLGKHFVLMPTFTYSGGFVTINDVVTRINNISRTADYQPKVQSFNIGISVGYQF